MNNRTPWFELSQPIHDLGEATGYFLETGVKTNPLQQLFPLHPCVGRLVLLSYSCLSLPVSFCNATIVISVSKYQCHDYGGHVAQWLACRNSNPKTLGSIPCWGRVRCSFFCPSESTLMQICLCMTSLRVYDTHLNVCAR